MNGKLLIISILSFLLFSCAAGEYTNNPYNISGFTEKGETRLNGNYGVNLTGGENINLSGAYALTDFLTLGANTSYILGEYKDKNPLLGAYSPNSKHKIKGSYFDLGVGYYKTSATQSFLFENYMGYGHAKILYTVTDLEMGNFTYVSDVNYHKIFNQFSVGWRSSSKYLELYLPLRVSYILFHDVKRASGYTDDNTLTELNDKFVYSFGTVIRFGTENIKLEISNSYYKYPVTINKLTGSDNYYFNVGVTVLNPFDLFNKNAK